MGSRRISKERLENLRQRYGRADEKDLVKTWEMADPRIEAARRQHGNEDDQDIILFGHRIRKMPEGSEKGLIIRVTNQHAGTLVRKVYEKVKRANDVLNRQNTRIDSSEAEVCTGAMLHDSESFRILGKSSHLSGDIMDSYSEPETIDDLMRSEGLKRQAFDFRPVEAYALGRKMVVMAHEKGVDLAYFHMAQRHRKLEKENPGSSFTMGGFLRESGIKPNIDDDTLEKWADRMTARDTYEIMQDLEGLGINKLDLFLTGVKNGRAQIVHLMDENRKEDFNPLPADLVERLRKAFLSSRKKGRIGESFQRLEHVDERVRPDERNYDVARTFPLFKVTIKRVEGGDAQAKIDSINNAVDRFSGVLRTPFFELIKPNAHALDDEFAVMPRTLDISLRELERGGSMYSDYVRSKLKVAGIGHSEIQNARQRLDDEFRVKYGGELYRMDWDQFIYAQVKDRRLQISPNIELGNRVRE